MKLHVVIAILSIQFLMARCYAEEKEAPNASEEARKAIALLIQPIIASEVNDKTFKSGETKKSVDVGLLSVTATANASMKFSEPKKNLKVEISEMRNGDKGVMKVKFTIKCPVKGTATANADPLSASLPVNGNLNLVVDSDVKLMPQVTGKVKTEMKIKKWTATIDDVDVLEGDANKVLQPVFKAAIDKIVEMNRKQLQDAASKALTKTGDDGALNVTF